MAAVSMRTGFISGFTLLEMLIALSIFSGVITIATGALITLQAAQSHAINLQNVHDNIRYTLDTMSREIRTGDSYCLSGSCVRTNDGVLVNSCDWTTSGCTLFSFRQSLSSDTIHYRLHNGSVERQITKNGVPGGYIPITDPDRTITNLTFYTTGSIGSAQRVTILIEVEAGDLARPGGESRMRMQTAVTKRRMAS